jgi:hypothetical protein
MSPPEVWGPAVWTLFHTLIEKLNTDAYAFVINSMFNIIVRICKYLPCPDCSNDASNFLAKINLNNIKTKTEFKNMIYLFHNWVNVKKKKQLYNFTDLNKYANLNLVNVINNFIKHYHTKGNMNLIAESFQRSLIIKDFLKWIKYYSKAFSNNLIQNNIPLNQNHTKEEKVVTEDNTLVEEKVVTEDNTILEVENTILEEDSILEEEEEEENIVLQINEKPIIEEANIVLEIKENTILEENMVLTEILN